MTYGFEARNSSGEVVIDQSFPVYELSEEKTVVAYESDSSGVIWRFSLPPAGTLRFWKMEVGDGVSLAPTYFANTKQTFLVRDVVRASILTAPTGYGMAVYNPSGQLTYSSNGELMTIGDKYFVTPAFGGTAQSVSTTDQWIAIETLVANLIPEFFQFFGAAFTSGCRRVTASSYEYFGGPYTLSPPVSIVTPVPFITAK